MPYPACNEVEYADITPVQRPTFLKTSYVSNDSPNSTPMPARKEGKPNVIQSPYSHDTVKTPVIHRHANMNKYYSSQNIEHSSSTTSSSSYSSLREVSKSPSTSRRSPTPETHEHTGTLPKDALLLQPFVYKKRNKIPTWADRL